MMSIKILLNGFPVTWSSRADQNTSLYRKSRVIDLFANLLVLREVDPSIYFPFLSVNRKSPEMTKKRRYKIAYLILAHKNKENLLELLKLMYSEDAIFIIHFDGNFPDILNQVRIYVQNDFKHDGNIFFVDNPFKCQW